MLVSARKDIFAQNKKNGVQKYLFVTYYNNVLFSLSLVCSS